jgi:poly(3-hydroxyalkanoate) synthetase
VFVDADQLEALEASMARKGYLEGRRMAAAFNMLRSNDLIWSYVVSNYLKGQQPAAFDLLHWNVKFVGHIFFADAVFVELAFNLSGGRSRLLTYLRRHSLPP